MIQLKLIAFVDDPSSFFPTHPSRQPVEHPLNIIQEIPECPTQESIKFQRQFLQKFPLAKRLIEGLIPYLQTLDPQTIENNIKKATQSLSTSENNPLPPLVELIRESFLDKEFSIRAHFHGNLSLTLRWLWDEIHVRPYLSIEGIIKAAQLPDLPENSYRLRTPIMPEELPMYLYPLLKWAREGFRVITIGKDGEVLTPYIKRLFNQFIKEEPFLEPLGMKITAKKNSIGQQIIELLSSDEKEANIPSPALVRIKSLIDSLPEPIKREATIVLDSTMYDNSCREDLVRLLADVGLDPVFNQHYALAEISECLNSYTYQQILKGTTIMIDDLVLQFKESLAFDLFFEICDKVKSKVVDRLSNTNHIWTMDHCIRSTFNELCINAKNQFSYPIAPILNIILENTELARIFNSSVIFLDVVYNRGTTFMFLIPFVKAISVKARNEYGVMRACVETPDQVEPRIFSFVASIDLIVNEDMPYCFDFYYDENGERIDYSYRIKEAETQIIKNGSPPSQLEIIDFDKALNEIIATCSEELQSLLSKLEQYDVPTGAVFRAWLRQDPVWTMHALFERIPWRHPYLFMVGLQQDAQKAIELLNQTITMEQMSELRTMDKRIWPSETKTLLTQWLHIYQINLQRFESALPHLKESQHLLTPNISEPIDSKTFLSNLDIPFISEFPLR